MGRTAGIAIIGDEILSGKFADENAQFLIGTLRRLGVALRRIAVITDDVDDIADTVPGLSARFDHVFTSGGVGPTHDDVTMAGIAKGFGTRVVVNPHLEELLREHLGPRFLPAHRRLAEMPEGAELVYGTSAWPVVCYRNVYILPGVPSIFRGKFLSIQDRFAEAPFVTGRVYCSLDESELAPHLTAAVAAHPTVKFGSYPRVDETEFRVIITVESKQLAAARAAFDALCDRLGAAVVRRDEPSVSADD